MADARGTRSAHSDLMTPSAQDRHLGRGRRRGAIAVAAFSLAAVLGLIASPASAHGGPTSAPQAVTADLGALQVRAVIGTASVVPGPLLIDISLTTAATSDLPVAVRAWPSSDRRPSRDDSTVRMLAGDVGPYPTQIEVDRAGPWDIELRLPDSVGPVHTVVIPITVTEPGGDPAEPARSIFYASAGAAALVGLWIAVLARRRAPRLSALSTQATAPVACAALAVAITLSLVPMSPPAPAGGTAGTTMGANLPHVNVTVAPIGATPTSDVPTTLEFLLSDGSSGLPVDDVAPHHEALLHVAVMGDSPEDFAHVHPARVSPGRYLLEWTPVTAGEHVVEIELTRGPPARGVDAGNQVVQSRIQVDAGPVSREPAPIGGLGTRDIGGLQVDVAATGSLVAGTPIGLTATVTVDGQSADLLPWFGMSGHMMVRERASGLFAHLHAVGPMPRVPALTGVPTDRGDPLIEQRRSSGSGSAPPPSGPTAASEMVSTIGFAYTFPEPGSYDAWIQFRHRDGVLTVPVALEVAP